MARSAGRVERDPLDPAHRSALGGPATTVSAASDVSRPLSEVGARRRLGPDPHDARRRLEAERKAGSDRGVHRRHSRRRKKGGLDVGITRRGKATKIMAVADRHGLPIAVWTASAQRHETKLVHDTLAARFVGPLPKKLIGDRAYDSDQLDAELRDYGVELIAPHNPTRKSKTQDGRALRRYRRRWHIERLFAWMMRFRRLVTRFEYRARNFLAFAKLACIAILLRQPTFRGIRRLGDSFPFNRLSDAF